MRTFAVSAALFATLACNSGAAAQSDYYGKLRVRVAILCFFKYEQPGGMNKICYYDCLGSLAAVTVSAIALCPLSIDR